MGMEGGITCVAVVISKRRKKYISYMILYNLIYDPLPINSVQAQDTSGKPTKKIK